MFLFYLVGVMFVATLVLAVYYMQDSVRVSTDCFLFGHTKVLLTRFDGERKFSSAKFMEGHFISWGYPATRISIMELFEDGTTSNRLFPKWTRV